MSTTAHSDYSAAVNSLYLEMTSAAPIDRALIERRFWLAVQRYVARVVNKTGTANHLISEIVQDVLIEINRCRDRFRPDPKYPDSSFSRWVCVIARNRTHYLTKLFFQNAKRTVPISQTGSQLDESGEYAVRDISIFVRELTASDIDDALDLELRSTNADPALDKLSQFLSPRDRSRLALLRSGLDRHEVARRTGVTKHTLTALIGKWRRLAAAHQITL
jgi:RNA polymerase sigma factor (sigma-70 family)